MFLPFPGLATQKITVSFSELALDAKLAFSILHKVQGTWLLALVRNYSSPWAKGGQRSGNGLSSSPSLNSA